MPFRPNAPSFSGFRTGKTNELVFGQQVGWLRSSPLFFAAFQVWVNVGS